MSYEDITYKLINLNQKEESCLYIVLKITNK